MPNCDFYGTPDDHAGLLAWLFDEGTCHVYESYSDFETPLKRFASASEVLAEFGRTYENGEKWKEVCLLLYVLAASPPFVASRVELNPRKCGGATYRFKADGWGLVQLYLAAPTKYGLEQSHTNHNTQARAEAWAPVCADLLDPKAWNFKRITSFSARLNRQIKKRSVGKRGSRPVLPGALTLWQSGVPFFPLNTGDVTVTARSVK